MENHPNTPTHIPNANIHSIDELVSLKKSVEVMIVDSNVCNNREYTILDLSSFSNLKVLEVGGFSFACVDEVKLIGLKQLERVVIGKNSFSEQMDRRNSDKDSLGLNRHFFLKDCERVRELRIGRYSLTDYSVCEIENVPSLEVIEIGELNKGSRNFYYASLELKSDSKRVK